MKRKREKKPSLSPHILLCPMPTYRHCCTACTHALPKHISGWEETLEQANSPLYPNCASCVVWVTFCRQAFGTGRHLHPHHHPSPCRVGRLHLHIFAFLGMHLDFSSHFLFAFLHAFCPFCAPFCVSHISFALPLPFTHFFGLGWVWVVDGWIMERADSRLWRWKFTHPRPHPHPTHYPSLLLLMMMMMVTQERATPSSPGDVVMVACLCIVAFLWVGLLFSCSPL